MEFFKTISLSEFPVPPKLVIVDSDTSVVDALKILSEHRILSAPVYDAKLKQYLGMIAMNDIVSHIVNTVVGAQKLGEGFERALEEYSTIAHATSAKITDLSSCNPFVAVAVESNLQDVIEILCRDHVHRVCVIDSKGNLVNIITQSAILNFVEKNLSKFPREILQKSVKELGIGHSPVITVDACESTATAFKILVDNHFSAIPVINRAIGEGMIANISVRDARRVAARPQDIYALHDTVLHFVNSLQDDPLQEMNPSIVCHEKDTLEMLIHKLCATRIHRIYVVDEHMRPISVISLVSVLRGLTGLKD